MRSNDLTGRKVVRFFLAALTAGVAGNAFAVEPAPVFGDRMVLQRDIPVPVWGTARPGEEIQVAFAGQEKLITADADGKWMVVLDPLSANATGQELNITGRNTHTYSDVLVGEVWLCSGQSNMQWPVSKSLDFSKEMSESHYPGIRVLGKLGEKWQACSPETVGNFSAVAYFFGREMHRRLGVPIGLITPAVGGTSAARWTPQKYLREDPVLWEECLKRLKRLDYPREVAEYESRLKVYEAQGGERAPKSPNWDEFISWRLGGWYAGMIEKLVPFAVRGVLWYQGENDVATPELYGRLFPALIRGWREEWGRELPFLFVQLANYGDLKAGGEGPTGSRWAYVREAQASALSLPGTGMAVAIDIGDSKDIHPKNKQEVARRLALLARNRIYAEGAVADEGPVYLSHRVEKGRLRIAFKKSRNLVLRGVQEDSFAVAGQDGVFHSAQAVIEDGELVVGSSQVPDPVNVRYAWRNDPTAVLFDEAGLPASPFRTDRMPYVPEGKGE